MLQIMHEWLQKLGNKQQSILFRLSQNAVRNHENVREGGEGGAPASEGSFATNQAHSFQQSIASYASHNVPGAQTVFNATGFGMNHGRERGEYEGGGSGRVSEGGAYYSESGAGGNGTSSFAPPPGPPLQIQSSYSYRSPSHEYPLAQASVPMQYGGYSPSYVSPSSPSELPRRSGFPGFPGSDGPQVVHGFPTPSGPPPGFPGGDGPTYGGHGHNESGFGRQGIVAGSMFPAPSGDSFGLPEPFNDVRTGGGGGGFHPPEGPPPGFPSSGQGYGYPSYPPPQGPPGW